MTTTCIQMQDISFLGPFVSSLKKNVNELASRNPYFKPTIAFVHFEEDGICKEHIRERMQLISACGVSAQYISVPNSFSENEALEVINNCNINPAIHGIIVQMSYGNACFNMVSRVIFPAKDVEGIHMMNTKLINPEADLQAPSIPVAISQIIKETGLSLENAHIVIFGNKEVCFPIWLLLKQNKATVSLLQSYNQECASLTECADVIISTIGEVNSFRGVCLKQNVIIIECSIYQINEDGRDSNTPIQDIKQFTSLHFSSRSTILLSTAIAAHNTILYSKKLVEHSTWKIKYLPLKLQAHHCSDIEISRSQTPKNVSILASEIGLLPHEFELYGAKKAKLSSCAIERYQYRNPGKYVVVTGITPTPLGEGKSTTTVGLSQALGAHLNKNVFACVRQPSQGPTFGIKGGAAGGGYSQVIPMEDFNLHLTGDIHAVTAANNLLAAQIDARMFHEATQSDEALFRRLVKVKDGKKVFSKIQISRLKKLGICKTNPDDFTAEERKRFARLDIDPHTITWNRVIDTNDRYLRKVKIGMSPTEKGNIRETQFDISVASEIMAILALATGMKDLKERLSRIVIANDLCGNPITADDLGVSGALAVLLKDALCPNLMQTLEGTPVLVHAGPFANIAHGNSSVIADKLALQLVGEHGFVVTEAGFGADIGFEKFCHIKCRSSGLIPNVVVLVATIRALKMHGGGPDVAPGVPIPTEYLKEDIDLVRNGYCNLSHHIGIVKRFGLPVIVAINRFSSDSDTELQLVKELCIKDGVFKCVVCEHFSSGGKGAIELAEAVVAASSIQSKFHFLYDLQDTIENKIRIIAQDIYGAKEVVFSSKAKEMIEVFEKQNFAYMPICMAKTHLSLSDDPTKKGAPKGFSLHIKDIKASVGAGFLYPLAGTISTMPGLPTRPAFFDMDINDENGDIEGLF